MDEFKWSEGLFRTGYFGLIFNKNIRQLGPIVRTVASESMVCINSTKILM